jgi:hypothetical protein
MAPLPKSVLIVGAGPAGLVAAKTLKQYGYTVSVYEAADCVGGMWKTKDGRPGEKCSPHMHTNLSRYTVSFSDLSWSSVDLDYLYDDSGHSQDNPPMFPMAWQVGEYLETYEKEFDIMSSVFLERRVSSTKLNKDDTWDVSYVDSSGKLSGPRIFDHLIVASSYFNKPAPSFDPSPSKDLPNIQHSSRFRTLSGLTNTPGKIVVIGGGISGSEAAAQAAFQISNAQYAPGTTKPAHAASKIYHVINRPFYSLPRYLPTNPRRRDGEFELAPEFLPLDLVLHNLSRRGNGEISAAITTMPPEKAQKGHAFLRDCLGGDQRDIGHSALVYKTDQIQYPAYTGITDTYKEFVRSGIVIPVQGQVEEVTQQVNGDLFDVSIKQSAPWAINDTTVSPLATRSLLDQTKTPQGSTTLTDVVGIIEATGYQSDLSWLDPQVQNMIGYDASSTNLRIPPSLSRGSIFCARAPTIGFIGFYPGPYWGVMEAQALLLAETWSKPNFAHLPDRDIYKHDTTEAMQFAINNKSLQVPQFWMGDYVGLMEELAREAGTTRSDTAFGGQQTGPIFPSRYQTPHTGLQASHVVNDVANVLQASNTSLRFVAPAVFTAMQGVWNIYRDIDVLSKSNTRGTFRGMAQFHPREPTASGYDKEYLYIEGGTTELVDGRSESTTTRFIYRFKSASETISVWFPQDEDEETAGQLCSTWVFDNPVDSEHGWSATGLQEQDEHTYTSTCDFWFQGAGLMTWMLKHAVKGEDYETEHESWFSRAEVERMEGVEYAEDDEYEEED